MAGKSNYLEDEILKYVSGQSGDLGAGASVVNVALYTAAPSDAGGGTECSGTNYARVDSSGDWGAPSGASPSQVQNTNIIQFPTAGGTPDWGTITHFALWDGSDMLYWAALTAPQVVGANETARFAVGALTITED